MTNTPLESLSRLRMQALAILAVVFVIGILTGVAIEKARRPCPPEAPPRDELPMEMRRELGLTPEQEHRIEKILKDNAGRTREVMDRIMPQLQALKDTIRADVRAELTPAQQEIFDRLERPLDAPPPGPPPNGLHFHPTDTTERPQ
jgi:hypothetical protein